MAIIPINIKEGTVDRTDTVKDIIIGIDLGTTNSLVAYMKDGAPVCVKDKEGNNALVPSVLHFAVDGSVVTGQAAREKLISDPQNTIYSVKRLMGKNYQDVQSFEQYFGYKIIDDGADSLVKIRVKDKFYTPVELSAFILKELKNRVEAELGRPATKAVITVPAYFNDTQRQATRDAAKLAGLETLRIINEPTAASLAYGLDRLQEAPQRIAVYDLGGGTFDVSILQIQDDIFEVLSTNGDTFLGGDDFDRVIMDYWIEKYEIDRKFLQNDKEFGQTMRLKAEQAKKELPGVDKFFRGSVKGRQFRISKARFETLIQPLIEKTIDKCKQALADAKLQVADIEAVVMVGGSTRIPLVKKTVSEFFQRPVYDRLNPDEVVALGAAIQADVLAGNEKGLLLIDVTPLSLGIETVGGLMDVIIARNSKIPSKAGRQYTTSVDGQKNLKVSVFQGERDLVEHNRKLGEFILTGIPPMPAGLPKIDVQFILDADGVLIVKAKELRSGVEQEINIRSQYGLSEEEMALMLIDSIQNAASDMQKRGLLEARNEANNIILSSHKFLKQNAGLLSKEEYDRTAEMTRLLKKSAKEDDKDAIQVAMDRLNEYTAPLAHRAMDETIANAMKGKMIV